MPFRDLGSPERQEAGMVRSCSTDQHPSAIWQRSNHAIVTRSGPHLGRFTTESIERYGQMVTLVPRRQLRIQKSTSQFMLLSKERQGTQTDAIVYSLEAAVRLAVYQFLERTEQAFDELQACANCTGRGSAHVVLRTPCSAKLIAWQAKCGKEGGI